MIKAQELRIGNWFYDSNGNLKQIGYTDLVSLEITCLHFKPIPLTPEILEKCGFVKELGKIDIFIKGRLRLWLGVRGETLCYLIEEDTTTGHYIPNNITSLHQLQNLFYCLTGTELEINLHVAATI